MICLLWKVSYAGHDAQDDRVKFDLQDGKGGGEGFEVQKYGDGRVALIGEQLIPALYA